MNWTKMPGTKRRLMKMRWTKTGRTYIYICLNNIYKYVCDTYDSVCRKFHEENNRIKNVRRIFSKYSMQDYFPQEDYILVLLFWPRHFLKSIPIYCDNILCILLNILYNITTAIRNHHNLKYKMQGFQYTA